MNVLAASLCIYFLMLPFQFALAPTEGIDLAVIRLMTIGLVGWWLVEGLISKRLVFPRMLPLFFLSGLLLLSWGSALWAENSWFTFRKALFFTSFFPLFLVLSAVFHRKPAFVSQIFQFFVIGAALASLTGIAFFSAQFLFGVERVFSFLLHDILPFFLGTNFAQAVATHPSLLVNISGVTLLRASGTFPDPHMFALYLGLAAPLALGLYQEASSVTKKCFFLVMFVLLLVGVALSFSRGAYLGLALGLGVFTVLALRSSTFFQRQRGRLFIVFFGIVLTFLVSPVGDRLFSSFSGEDGSRSERLYLWHQATEYITKQPLLGVGLGNYVLTVNPGATYRDPLYAHNLYLDVAVELGIIGLAFFLALVILAVRGSWRGWRLEQNGLALGGIASLTVFLTHAFFETPLFSVHILPVLVLLLSVGVSYRYDKSSL